jgi:DNA invertase Pin-like site-specific DNA recombinase
MPAHLTAELIVNVLAAIAQWEREMISQRTREGLTANAGYAGVSDDVRARIRREHREGRSLHAIARDLNADAVPTGHGGKQWYASSVRSILKSE